MKCYRDLTHEKSCNSCGLEVSYSNVMVTGFIRRVGEAQGILRVSESFNPRAIGTEGARTDPVETSYNDRLNGLSFTPGHLE